MPRPRFNKLTEERRRELLECAGNEFALHGYEGASLNGIILSAGLSKGAFYYYFDDKADLFETVLRFAVEELVGADASAFDVDSLDAESFWPSVERWFLDLTARMHELPWLAGLGKLIYRSPAVAGVEDLVAEGFATAHDWLGDLLRRGRRLGVVRDDLPLELIQLMVIGAMEGSDRWFVEHWHELDPLRRDQLAAATLNTARSMLACPDHPESTEGDEVG